MNGNINAICLWTELKADNGRMCYIVAATDNRGRIVGSVYESTDKRQSEKIAKKIARSYGVTFTSEA